jgi:hypothetical protein
MNIYYLTIYYLQFINVKRKKLYFFNAQSFSSLGLGSFLANMMTL